MIGAEAGVLRLTEQRDAYPLDFSDRRAGVESGAAEATGTSLYEERLIG